jgi:hypothetical protein
LNAFDIAIVKERLNQKRILGLGGSLDLGDQEQD